MSSGTIIRHINGLNLPELQQVIEKLSYRVTPISVGRVGVTWYIHFMVNPLAINESPKASPIEMAEETQTKTVNKKTRKLGANK